MSDPQQQAVSLDAFAPAGIAQKLEAANVARAGLSARKLILLGLLGGLYIGFGGALATLVLTDNTLGYGLGRLAAGLSFSLGLIMLVVAGGELFTGNNLMILAFAGRMVTARAMLRNWGLAYGANAAGAALLALAIHFSGILDGNGVQATAVRIAEAKAQLGMSAAFLRAILCNMLVCLAVWLSTAARSVEGKAIVIAFPISAFVALGFEHCIANFYLLPDRHAERRPGQSHGLRRKHGRGNARQHGRRCHRGGRLLRGLPERQPAARPGERASGGGGSKPGEVVASVPRLRVPAPSQIVAMEESKRPLRRRTRRCRCAPCRRGWSHNLPASMCSRRVPRTCRSRGLCCSARGTAMRKWRRGDAHWFRVRRCKGHPQKKRAAEAALSQFALRPMLLLVRVSAASCPPRASMWL